MILLADDSVHALRMGEQILRGEGFEVVTATGGQAAIKLLDELTPGMLIVDAFLPERSGLDLCSQVKGARPLTRVILTAGALEEIDEVAARAAGCDAILRKPFEASAMAEMVKRLARDSPGDGELRAVIAELVEAEMPRFAREIIEKVWVQMRGK